MQNEGLAPNCSRWRRSLLGGLSCSNSTISFQPQSRRCVSTTESHGCRWMHARPSNEHRCLNVVAITVAQLAEDTVSKAAHVAVRRDDDGVAKCAADARHQRTVRHAINLAPVVRFESHNSLRELHILLISVSLRHRIRNRVKLMQTHRQTTCISCTTADTCVISRRSGCGRVVEKDHYSIQQ